MASHIVRCPISCKCALLFKQHNVVNCERRMYQIKLAAVVAICLNALQALMKGPSARYTGIIVDSDDHRNVPPREFFQPQRHLHQENYI
jgi:hypothetical protein